MEIKHGFKVGDKALRRNSHYPDAPDKWIEFTVNETYMQLMNEFPEDYRTLKGKQWIRNNVSCDICGYKWDALYVEGAPRLQCPYCKQMAYHTVI